MTDWVKAADADVLGDGDMLGVEIAGEPVCLYRVGDTVYATHDICTHALAHLSDGFFDTDDCFVECPLHAGRFDVRTGEPIDGPVSEAVRTYEARIERGAIVVKIR